VARSTAPIVVMLACATIMAAQSADAQQAQPQNLSQDANDPTAALMSFQLQNSWSPSLYNTDGASQNTVQFRAAIPFEAAGLQNIFRITVPGFTDTPSGETGISDTVLFDLVTFDRSWGRFGVGVVALAPTGGEALGAEKWAVGPAAGFTAKSGRWLWGAFNQNLLTVAGNEDRADVNL
jgi:hypothetical protein